MVTIKDFLQVIDYRITEGSDYGWTCFGSNVHVLSFWNGDQDGSSANITFDTKTQTVYVAEVCDYRNNRAYRLLNPDYKQQYFEYAKSKNCDADQAWDDIKYTDLDIDEDWLDKTRAIVQGLEYDSRVPVTLNMNDDELHVLMKLAHERDITLNKLVEEILTEAMK